MVDNSVESGLYLAWVVVRGKGANISLKLKLSMIMLQV